MAVTTTYRTSYGSRVTSSVKNIMLGVILFFSATGLLWWNEGRAVKTTAPTIDFGAYQLSEELKKQLKNYSPAAPQPSEEQYRLLVDRATQAFSRYRGSSERLVTYQGNMVYVGGSDPSSPSIGDVRITFRQVSPGDFSLLAVVKDTSFKEYVAKNEYSFNRIEPGKISSEQMYKNEHHDNAIMTWVLRFIGLLLSVFGINLMFGVVYTVLSIIPFVGKAAEVGIGIVATVLGTCWSLIIIGTAWVFYRPLLGLGMFAVVVLVIILASTVGVKKTKGTPEGELPADEGGQVPPPVPAAPAAPQQFASPAYQPQQRVAPPTFNAPPPPPPIPQGDAAPAPQPPYQTPPPIPQD